MGRYATRDDKVSEGALRVSPSGFADDHRTHHLSRRLLRASLPLSIFQPLASLLRGSSLSKSVEAVFPIWQVASSRQHSTSFAFRGAEVLRLQNRIYGLVSASLLEWLPVKSHVWHWNSGCDNRCQRKRLPKCFTCRGADSYHANPSRALAALESLAAPSSFCFSASELFAPVTSLTSRQPITPAVERTRVRTAL